MIKWLFFDVGNVILNDDPWMAVVYERLYEAIVATGRALTFEELLAEREHLIVNSSDGNISPVLAKKYLGGEDGWQRLRRELANEIDGDYLRHHRVMAGVGEVLKELSAKYRLGLAANQTLGCRGGLAQLGFLQHFGVAGLSEEIGLAKPQPEFFQHLLDQAKCAAAEAVMIGDRIDNDITPAAKLGMRTIWVKLDLRQKGYAPESPRAKAYFQSQLRTNISRLEPRGEQEQPDVTITSVRDIGQAVAEIVNQG